MLLISPTGGLRSSKYIVIEVIEVSLKKDKSMLQLAFMRKCCYLILLLLLIPIAAHAAGCWEGKAVGAVDCTTIVVMRNGKRVQVRVHGISVPSSARDRSLYELFFLVKDRQVRVCPKKGAQPSADVSVLKGFMINVAREMVKNGHAHAAINKYKAIEKKAMEKQRGIWSRKLTHQRSD
jgi:endonuclease YncB( thermonuclease family)